MEWMLPVKRRDILSAASLAALSAVMAAGCAKQVVHGQHDLTEDTAGLTPDQALARLTEGNARFAAMTEAEPNKNTERLVAVAGGQQPFVGVLGCVDSRVPPELVFDRGLGDIFDTRIAGAIADDSAIGSLEFGVGEFGVPLLVVLGHSGCGAVTAAVKELDAGSPALPGRIGAVVDPIIPAVKAVRAQGVSADDVIDAAAREVVRRGVAALRSSPVLFERITSGKLKAVGAFYQLQTGRVEFLD